MELDDLQRRWLEQDAKFDLVLKLTRRLLQQPVLDRAAARTRRLGIGLWFELVMNLAALVLLGGIQAAPLPHPGPFIARSVLQLAAIALVVVSIRQLVALSKLDYSAPIVTIQRRMEALRRERLRATQWTLVAAPLLWTPLFIVAMKALLNVDAVSALGVPYVAANLAVGAVVIVAAIWLSRRHAERMSRAPLVQRLMRHLAGSNLAAASGYLESIDEFGRE
jgi:hypothetical protein